MPIFNALNWIRLNDFVALSQMGIMLHRSDSARAETSPPPVANCEQFTKSRERCWRRYHSKFLLCFRILPPFTLFRHPCRQNYNLTIESARPIGTGAMSTTMRLVTNRGTLFLKIYKSARKSKNSCPTRPSTNCFYTRCPKLSVSGGFPCSSLTAE